MGSSEITFAVGLSQEDQDILGYFGQFLDTFDSSSPCYQAKHTGEEVFRLVEDCGVENLNFIEQPIAGQGRGVPNPRPVPEAEVERCAE